MGKPQVVGPDDWLRARWREAVWFRMRGTDRPVIWGWRRMMEKTRLVFQVHQG